jgi:hypothetical protein
MHGCEHCVMVCPRMLRGLNMSGWSGSRQGYRGLWASVVLQALDDIWGRPMGSSDYSQAVSFFTGTGTWAEARTTIGDFLEFHSDDLEALGKRCIDARLAREALQSETPHPSQDAFSRSLIRQSGQVASPQKANARSFPRSWNGALPSSPHVDRNGGRPALMPTR